MVTVVRRKLLTAGPAVLLTLLTATEAHAHALSAECRLHGNQIEVQAYFDDDTPVRNAQVSVYGPARKEVARGRTDSQGRCTLPAPPPGTYEVIVDAGAGHRATLKITVPPRDSSSEDALLDPSPEAAPLISDGPTREEFTRFPWGNVVLGLGVIALGGLVLLGLVRRRKGEVERPL